MTQGKTAGDSENATSRRQRATTRESKQERGDDTREQHRPDRKGPTASNGSDGNHAASRRHRHGGKEQDTQEEPPRNIHGPATTSNRQQRPRRTHAETQTATAPPPLSNERGAERYDDRTERIASRHDGGAPEESPNERHEASKTRRDDNRTRSHEKRTMTDDDAPHRMSKERGEGRDENGHARAYPIRSHHSSDREPRRPIHHPRRAVFASSPQTARSTRGRREAHTVHMKNENPISE